MSSAKVRAPATGAVLPRLLALVDTVFGHRLLECRSARPCAAAVERLAAATERAGTLEWSEPTLAGYVSEEAVYLVRQTGASSGGFRVRFAGRLVPEGDGCRLVGRFVLPWTAVLLFLIALAVCGGWLVSALARLALGAGNPSEVAYAAATVLGVGGFLLASRVLARRDRRWLTDRIVQALDVSEDSSE